MYWFLYYNGLRLERVKSFLSPSLIVSLVLNCKISRNVCMINELQNEKKLC